MTVRDCLLVFPVHRRSRDKYYSDHDAYVAREKAKLERNRGKPFDTLPPNMRKSFESQRRWPSWEFNDLAGFVKVGLGTGRRMTGDIYLKRKHLHRDNPERKAGA